jgi:hypothetical protein
MLACTVRSATTVYLKFLNPLSATRKIFSNSELLLLKELSGIEFSTKINRTAVTFCRQKIGSHQFNYVQQSVRQNNSILQAEKPDRPKRAARLWQQPVEKRTEA